MPVSVWNGKNTTTVQLIVPGEYVVVKNKFGRDDRKAVQQRLLSAARMDMEGDVQGLDAGVAYDAVEFATLEQVIIEGRFQNEEDGSWIKLDRSNKRQLLRGLDDDTRAFLRDKLNELYPSERTEEESLNSESDGITLSSTDEIPSHGSSLVTQ